MVKKKIIKINKNKEKGSSFPALPQPAQLRGQTWQDISPAQNSDGNTVTLPSFARELSAGPLAPRLLLAPRCALQTHHYKPAPSKSSKPYHLPGTGQQLRPRCFEGAAAARGNGGKGGKSCCVSVHRLAPLCRE